MEELLTTFSEYLFAAAVTVVLISLVTAAAFSLILTVAGGGISKISERRQRKKALAKTEGSYVVSGTIADAETITTQTDPSRPPSRGCAVHPAPCRLPRAS